MVGVVGAAAEAGVVERVVVPGPRDGAAGGERREAARGEDAAREGAVDRGDGRGGGVGGGRLRGGGGSRRGWRGRRRAVALDVELEEVEERAGDEGAEHEAAPALHHPLQRHHDAHPAVRPPLRPLLAAVAA